MNRMTRLTHITNAFCSLLLSVGAAAVAGEPREPIPTAPTLYYACMSAGGRTEYDSAAFASKNPGPDYQDHYNLSVKMTAAFDAYLTQKYGFHGVVNCGRHNTLAEAKQWLQWRENESRAPGKNYEYFTTGWVYNPTPSAAAQPVSSSPTVASAPSTPKPVVPAPVTSQPAASQLMTAVAAIKPATTAPAAAPKGVFVVCYADEDPRTRYYNSPVDGGDGNYGTWMPSYQSFMQQKYHYQRSVRCNRQPTLAEAQAYYQTTLDQARALTSINGMPSPIVVTDWKYK